MEMDIGLARKDCEAIVQRSDELLANTYTLYLKTQNFHWNVIGPMFQKLHVIFGQQYTELADAVNLIAERIRALGSPTPGTFTEFARLSSIKEPDGAPSAEGIIKQLVPD